VARLFSGVATAPSPPLSAATDNYVPTFQYPAVQYYERRIGNRQQMVITVCFDTLALSESGRQYRWAFRYTGSLFVANSCVGIAARN
jgi:hypothetical protein